MRSTVARISLKQITDNVHAIRSHCAPNTKICAVVKANAYGHGLVAVAHALEKVGVEYFAVALVEEGVALREAGVRTPVLVLGGISHVDVVTALKHDMTLTVSSVEKLETMVHESSRLGLVPRVHLKIDTGMGRVGVQFDRAEVFLATAASLHQSGAIICEGIYSHFAESTDDEYTRLQFERFISVCNQANSLGLGSLIRHISSSRALFLFPEYHLDMVRPGIALYGIEPETDRAILPPMIVPALSLETEIVYFKALPKGTPVGYGRTWKVAQEYERIITLPIGYADGFDRRLTNCGEVIIRGQKYPIVGRVCMDQCMATLGKDGVGYVGDTVIIIGSHVDSVGSKTSISVVDIAKQVGTTPHEIVVSITDRVPRAYT